VISQRNGSPCRWEGPLLVVDDVITTGATLRSAAVTLQESGLSQSMVGFAVAVAD
jgi:predicted amidophosphoribosyltransferase